MATFFEIGLESQLGNENQLVKINKLINWERFRGYLKKIHKNEDHDLGGPIGYDPLKMFKAILLGQWHSLSDPGLEEGLRVRLDFMAFTGFEMGCPIPDETTLCRFRNKLVTLKLDKKLMKFMNAELEKLGIQIESAQGALVDATIIESSARPRKEIIVSVDRQEKEETTPQNNAVIVEINESKDPDSRWIKKGKKSYFGYKGFVSVTKGEGYIQTTHVCPANKSEMTEFRSFISDIPSKEIFTDKGYTCQENNDLLSRLGKKSRIMRKAARNRPLKHWEKVFNRLISHHRFRVEQTFGTLKRRFHMSRFRYMTLQKVQSELIFKSMGLNLLKAANSLS
jgi:transposase, IS5 family